MITLLMIIYFSPMPRYLFRRFLLLSFFALFLSFDMISLLRFLLLMIRFTPPLMMLMPLRLPYRRLMPLLMRRDDATMPPLMLLLPIDAFADTYAPRCLMLLRR